jgi:hypothetical protein
MFKTGQQGLEKSTFWAIGFWEKGFGKIAFESLNFRKSYLEFGL